MTLGPARRYFYATPHNLLYYLNMKLAKKSSWKRNLGLFVSFALIGSGTYIMINIFSPFFSTQLIDPKNNSTTKLLAATPETKITENRLYIPKIDINLPYAAGDASVMENGAWWRKPDNGNPQDGGNFVLSAHRFIMGLTPAQTLRKSPFYNIDKLQIGDEITVDYNGKRYVYAISKIFDVKPDAVHIENRTEQAQLTLYSCTLGGAADGRNVFIAVPKH